MLGTEEDRKKALSPGLYIHYWAAAASPHCGKVFSFQGSMTAVPEELFIFLFEVPIFWQCIGLEYA